MAEMNQLDNNNNIVGFPDNSNDNILSKFKEKITAKQEKMEQKMLI